MKTYEPRHKKRRHPTYYKTICQNCDLILSVRWKLAYAGVLPTRIYRTRQNVCPFCQGTLIKTTKINQSEYIAINQQWDMVDLTEIKDNHLGDWTSWSCLNEI